MTAQGKLHMNGINFKRLRLQKHQFHFSEFQFQVSFPPFYKKFKLTALDTILIE